MAVVALAFCMAVNRRLLQAIADQITGET